MTLTDNTILKLLHGDEPLIFKDICIIYPPKLSDIAAIGLDKFFSFISVLLIEKPVVEAEDAEASLLLERLTDFTYLIAVTQMEPDQYKLFKEAINFFSHEEVTIVTDSPSIVFGDVTEKRILTQEDFEDFQQVISWVCAMMDEDESALDLSESSNDDARTAALKKKLKAGRKQRRKSKAQKSKASGNQSNIKISDMIASLAIGSNGAINIFNVWDLTYYAFQDQLKRMGWKEEFEMNTRAALAGAKIQKEKLSHWIKSMTFN